MRFQAFWALARLAVGVSLALVFAGVAKSPIPINQPFEQPLMITAVYLLFIEFMAFLVQPGGRRRHQLRARYWDPLILGHTDRFYCKAAAASKVEIEFEGRAPAPMVSIGRCSSWWYAGTSLSSGEHRYRYVVHREGGTQAPQLDEGDPKVGDPAQERSLRKVSDVREFPKIRITNRTSLIQILTVVAGFMIAFSGRQGITPNPYSLTLLLSGVLLGVLYMLILNGGIREERKTDDGREVISISRLHEILLEVVLNLEVISLLIGSSAFFS